MLENISKKNYKALKFKPLVDYIKSLEKFNSLLIKDEEIIFSQGDSSYELIYKINEEYMNIIILKDCEKEWISFYRYDRNDICYEEIVFLIFTSEKRKEDGIEYNNVIRYSAHFEDELYSKLITSAYTYLDNKYINGWRQKRKISIEDLKKIFVDNRAVSELPSRAEEKMLDFYEAIDLKEGEVKQLVLGYDE